MSSRRVLDRVARQVAQRLGEAVGSAASVPSGTGPSSKRRSAVRLSAVPQLLDERVQVDRLGPQEVGLLGLGEQQQVVDEPADAGDLGLHEPLDAAHLVAGRVLLRGQHLELAADHRQRRAQLVRGVGDELALAANASASRSSMWLNASASTRTSPPLPAGGVHPRLEVAGVDARGDAAIRRSGAVTRAPAR